MAERVVVEFQRGIRRWTSKGDNIRGTSAAKWLKRDKIIEISVYLVLWLTRQLLNSHLIHAYHIRIVQGQRDRRMARGRSRYEYVDSMECVCVDAGGTNMTDCRSL